MSEEDSIIREVEEDLRRERYEQLWKRYGPFVIGTIAVVLISMVGWQQWQAWQDRQREKEAAAFMAAVDLLEKGNEAAAAEAFGELATDAAAGYRAVARLHEADAHLQEGNPEQALAALDSLAGDSAVNPRLRGLAALKGGLLLADSAAPQELEQRLKPALRPASPWRHSAQELVAYAWYREGNFKEARNAYQTLANQYDAPSSIRSRAGNMLALISSEEAQGKGAGAEEDSGQDADGATQAPPAGNGEDTAAPDGEESSATEDTPAEEDTSGETSSTESGDRASGGEAAAEESSADAGDQ